LGLDPTQRDKVIAMRRQLGEYARMARFVGSMSPGMTQNFRRLGRALDEVSAVLMVMLGESLASVGFATGYYLLQVPLQELQQRRDAVIFALRNFNGGAQQSYGPDDWPRGIDAYRRLYQWLEVQGQGDLRSLLLENDIAQTMDALITRAQNGTSDGLRALGVTAQIDIERFRRMVLVAPGAMFTNGRYDRSPPLEAYLQALGLFSETFKPAGGLRLLRIARPSILLYGLYNVNQLENDNTLFDLIAIRGTLAVIFDGLFPSNAARGVQPQVLLDMLLSELDRAIDLLALGAGTKEGGPTEWRATAHWAIIGVIRQVLTEDVDFPPLSPIEQRMSEFSSDIISIREDYKNGTTRVPGLKAAFNRYDSLNLKKAPTPPKEREKKTSVDEELRVQLTLEDRWENLVRTIAPEAGNQELIFALLRMVIEQAIYEVNNKVSIGSIVPYEERLPPQFEESLEHIRGRL
jgi:hypothetical protein